MDVFISKMTMLKGTSYKEVSVLARKYYNSIRTGTKRQPYVRSRFFHGDKVFIAVFWEHLAQKHQKERTRRLKFYVAALDLLRNTMTKPEVTASSAQHKYSFYRFYGITRDGTRFCVQVRADEKTGRKDFMSVFARKYTSK